jgi:nucleotide-binding universal stress UspA family protein
MTELSVATDIAMPTKNVLVPVDGSANSLRALKHAAERYRDSSHVCLLLLNVQHALPASSHVKPAMIRAHHAQMSEEALEPARELARKSGVMFDSYFLVGEPAASIASFARRTRCREIIMGTRGLGRVRGLLLGSVTTKVISLADIPVTLVK